METIKKEFSGKLTDLKIKAEESPGAITKNEEQAPQAPE